MAKNRSEKSTHQSSYGGGWCPPTQIISEIICERLASFRGKVLPHMFWRDEAWKRDFLMQRTLAEGLAKIYRADSIIKALRSPEGRNIRSLSAPWLDPLIKAEEAKASDLERRIQEAGLTPEIPVVSESPRLPSGNKGGIRGKLKGL